MRGPCGDVTVFCLDYINVTVLVVLLYYNFIKCYHRGKVGKGHQGFFCGISCLLHMNLQ